MKLKKALLLTLPAMLLGGCFSFNTDMIEEETGPKDIDDSSLVIVPDESVSGTLNIRFYKRGFGDSFLQQAKYAFQKKYPKVAVEISSSTEAKVVYAETIGGVETKYDLYISEASIMDYTDKFVNINDVFSSTVEGENVTIENKVEKFYLDSCKDGRGDYYTLPAYCGAYGIVYNRDFISENQIPKTSDELVALCSTLKSQSITPFVYSGGDSSIYLNFLYSTWAAQYEGQEQYLMAQKGRVWDQANNRYKTDVSSAYLTGYLKSMKALEDIFWVTKMNSSTQCVGYNANAAQEKLLDASNTTAMMWNGSWIMNEMATMIKGYDVDINDFGMMKAPVLSAIREKCASIENDAELSALVSAIDKKDTSLTGDGYDVTQADYDRVAEARSFVYAGSEGSRMVITKKAQHQDLAKLFMKFYYTNACIAYFNESNSGCFVPAVNTTIDLSKKNKFYKDVYSILTEKTKFFNVLAAFQAVTPSIVPDGKGTIEQALGSPNSEDRATAQEMFDWKKTTWTANNNQKFKDEMGKKGYQLDD